jgi:uncharacterized protein (TIGR03083 family)
MVDNAAADAVRRVRRRGTGWWRGSTPCPEWDRADVVQHLAEALAIYEHGLEVGAGPRPETFRRPPRPERDTALPDRLAVVAADLVTAFRAKRPGDVGRHPNRLMRVETLAAVALAECVVHTYDVDPRPLPEDAAGAVLALLHPRAAAELAEGVGSLGELLLRVERGPRERDWELRAEDPA